MGIPAAGGNGLPIVLVHGLVVSSRYLLPTARRLAATHRVYAPDLPGFGRSDKPPASLDVPALADALVGWMDAAGLQTVGLVGNSLGCQVIVDLAVRHPTRVAAAILIGPTTDPACRDLLRLAVAFLATTPFESPALQLVVARDLLAAGVPRFLATFQHMLADPVEAKLPLVAPPTLVLRGGRDSIVQQAWAERVCARLPRARLAVVPGAGHALNYSRPDEVARLVRTFLAEMATGFEVAERPRAADRAS